MATKTSFLSLVKPANNEFNNTWDIPLNANFDVIDAEIESISNELQSSRGSLTSLAEFLNVAHFSDGTLKPSEEADDARNSPVYGDDEGGTDFLLKNRLDKADREVYDAREGEANLLANLAQRLSGKDFPDRVISGAKTPQNQPNFLSSSGAEFLLNGDPEAVLLNIGGYLMKVSDDVSTVVTGVDGTKYLVAKRPATPFQVVNRTTQENGVTTSNPLNNSKVQILQDTAVDFTALKVRAGMILNILNTQNAGQYVIAEVAPDGNVDQLLIVGIFKTAIGSTNFEILDPLRPELSVETSFTEEDGKCIIGEGEFSSGALISSFAYAFKSEFESSFVAIDVSSLASFEQIFNHNLGRVPREIYVYASQANDDSAAWEPLSTSLVGNDLDVDITNSLSFTPGAFDPGTTDAEYVEGSLTGTTSGTISGTVFSLRSVQIKMTKTQIFVKNAKANHFYRDYDGTDRNQGFLKVVCKL